MICSGSPGAGAPATTRPLVTGFAAGSTDHVRSAPSSVANATMRMASELKLSSARGSENSVNGSSPESSKLKLPAGSSCSSHV